jgi:hypothetical protein
MQLALERSSGNHVLEAAALHALDRWRYGSSAYAGRAVCALILYQTETSTLDLNAAAEANRGTLGCAFLMSQVSAFPFQHGDLYQFREPAELPSQPE